MLRFPMVSHFIILVLVFRILQIIILVYCDKNKHKPEKR